MMNHITNKPLRILFIVHGIITIAAGVVLIIAPASIPQTVGIQLLPNQFLLCYFLAAAELAIGFLSISTISIKEFRAIRLITISFIIFHLVTALLELWVLHLTYSSILLTNIFVRLIVVALFGFWAMHSRKEKEKDV